MRYAVRVRQSTVQVASQLFINLEAGQLSATSTAHCCHLSAVCRQSESVSELVSVTKVQGLRLSSIPTGDHSIGIRFTN